MATRPERRHVARLPVSIQLSGRGMGQLSVRLLDLSPEGARIEHVRPLADRGLCFLNLPLALGGAWLRVEAIWTQVTERQKVVEGKGGVTYQCGLQFTLLTPGQRASLTAALALLKAAREAPPAA